MKRLFTLPGLGKSLAKKAKTPITDITPAKKHPRKSRSVHFQKPDFFLGNEEGGFFIVSCGRLTVPSGPRENVGISRRRERCAHQCPTVELASREGIESGFSRRRLQASLASRRTFCRCSMYVKKSVFSNLALSCIYPPSVPLL